jgi:hypothetical protein
MASPCIRPMRQLDREVPAGRGQDDGPGADLASHSPLPGTGIRTRYLRANRRVHPC